MRIRPARWAPGKIITLNPWPTSDCVAVPMVELRTVDGATLYVRERPLTVDEFVDRLLQPDDWVETTQGRVRFDRVVEIRDYMWWTLPEAIPS